jgi:hypothetical protein
MWYKFLFVTGRKSTVAAPAVAVSFCGNGGRGRTFHLVEQDAVETSDSERDSGRHTGSGTLVKLGASVNVEHRTSLAGPGT